MTTVSTAPAWLPTNYENTTQDFPAWLIAQRLENWQAFLKNGLPTKKNERWKYSDLSLLASQQFCLAEKATYEELEEVIHQHRLRLGDNILMVMVNGYFMPSLSDLHKIPKQLIACSLQEALQRYPELIEKNDANIINAEKFPFAALNQAMWTEGLFIYLPDNVVLKESIHLLSITTDQHEFMAQPHHQFIVGEHSQLQLIEESFSLSTNRYFINAVNTVSVGKNATLNYCKIQHEGSAAIHIAATFMRQHENSTVNYMNFSFGGLFARDDVIALLKESGAACKATGLYCLQQDQQYIDQHIDILHQAPRSTSEMLYKGLLNKKSRAVFNGRLVVEQDAQKIVAHQANHNLLLSQQAEVYSKPELEIYADDVKCKHGATTGQIDQDALFYLRSRGISEQEAMSMLLKGFTEEIMDRITHPGVKLRIQELVSCL